MKLEELRRQLRPKKKEPEPSEGRHPSGVEFTMSSTTLDGNQNSLKDWRDPDAASAMWKKEYMAEFTSEYQGQAFAGIDHAAEEAESHIVFVRGKELFTIPGIPRKR